MERVMRILPDVLALVAGGLLAIAICELLQRLIKFKRFATAWILLFVPFGLIMPPVIRVLIFPYTGVMSGMNYITTTSATLVAVIFYAGTFCWTVLANMTNRRRYSYCLFAFYIVGILFLLYVASDDNGPVIE